MKKTAARACVLYVRKVVVYRSEASGFSAGPRNCVRQLYYYYYYSRQWRGNPRPRHTATVVIRRLFYSFHILFAYVISLCHIIVFRARAPNRIFRHESPENHYIFFFSIARISGFRCLGVQISFYALYLSPAFSHNDGFSYP